MADDFSLLMNLVRNRRSIRRFREDPVEETLVDRILEAARWAPSAGNRQAFRFLVVRDHARISAMAEAVQKAIDETLVHGPQRETALVREYAANFLHFASAPVVLVPFHRQSQPNRILGSDFGNLASVSAAITQALLAAHALNLGACWMTGPLIAKEVLEIMLEIPSGWQLSALIPLGYPAESPEAPPRQPLWRLKHQAKVTDG